MININLRGSIPLKMLVGLILLIQKCVIFLMRNDDDDGDDHHNHHFHLHHRRLDRLMRSPTIIS